MITGNSSDLPQKSLQIKQDDKFFTKLLSKETSMANPSFRVYYGGVSGAVPFLWESQPGTPKHNSSETSLPPLTPPPSYYSNSNKNPSKRKYSRSKLLHSLFPKMNTKKAQVSSSSLSPSWSSTQSSSTPFNFNRQSQFSSPMSSFDSSVDEEEEEAEAGTGSPTSTLCYRTSNGGLRGCYSVLIMKKALLSIVSHGSGQGTTA